MIGTIQERNKRVYIVVQNGGQLEYYLTVHYAKAYFATYGNHVGEQVTDETNVNGVWRSLDGRREYKLAQLEPEFVEGVKLEAAGRPGRKQKRSRQ